MKDINIKRVLNSASPILELEKWYFHRCLFFFVVGVGLHCGVK
jgi:hypothetical protein